MGYFPLYSMGSNTSLCAQKIIPKRWIGLTHLELEFIQGKQERDFLSGIRDLARMKSKKSEGRETQREQEEEGWWESMEEPGHQAHQTEETKRIATKSHVHNDSAASSYVGTV